MEVPLTNLLGGIVRQLRIGIHLVPLSGGAPLERLICLGKKTSDSSAHQSCIAIVLMP